MDKLSLWGDSIPIDSDISDFVEKYIDGNDVHVVFVDNHVANLTGSALELSTSNELHQRKRIYFNGSLKYVRDPKVALFMKFFI